MYPEEKLVQKCLWKIEGKLGWGPSQKWHNDVFLELSDRIQEETKVLLSPVTLKRIWGRIDYKSAPSKTTLNTLAQFAGYTNWRDFKSSISKKKTNPISKIIAANTGVIVLSASIMTVIFISFFSLKGNTAKTDPINPENIVFKSRPIVDGLPNTVVFDVDLPGVTSDSMHIQQYWDPTKTINLAHGQKQATGQYYRPGYFRAKLLVDGQIVKQHDLFIKSNGWIATLDYNPIPKYLESESISGKTLRLPQETIDEIRASDVPLTSTFHLVDELPQVSGDNFILQSIMQNTYDEKWAVCQNASIIILGTKGAIIFTFTIPGCSSEVGIMLNDRYISGKKQDLSVLGIDLSTPKEIKVKVEEKEVLISLGEETLFTSTYNQPMGRIVGLRYKFLGAGEILQSKLTNLDASVIAIEHPKLP